MMNPLRTTALRVLALSLWMGLLAACGGQTDGPSSYTQSVMQDRVQRDMRMREKESVVPVRRRDAFQGLDHYPVDRTYRYVVPLERSASLDTVMMAESTGGVRPQVQIGTVTVPLPGGPTDLLVFRGEGDDPRGRRWIPFADSTNQFATYRGGRYVDLKPAGPDSVVVDFNRAYNPTCAYNPDFTCPLPPPENRLRQPVSAGERRPIFRPSTAQ